MTTEPTPTPDGETTASQLRPLLMDLAMATAPIKEFAAGYRAELIRDGWSPEAAEAMAVQAHNSILAVTLAPSS